MKSDLPKFDKTTTKMLITFRHSDEYNSQFTQNDKNNHQKKRLWSDIADRLSTTGNIYDGTQCQKKYSMLRQTFNEFNDQIKVSGSPNIKWMYWDLFNETIPEEERDVELSGVEELGVSVTTEENEVVYENISSTLRTSDNNPPKKKNTLSPRSEVLQTLNEVLKLEIKKHESEIDSTKALNDIQNDIKDLKSTIQQLLNKK